MSQPLDRMSEHPQLGEVDEAAGEFWVTNPFLIPQMGENLSAYERNRLFLNNGGDDFLDASFVSNANIDSDSRSVIATDFNQDGRVDLLVASVGGGPLRLFLNRMPQGNRIQIQLKGKTSNRAGIGARLTAFVGDRKIVRDAFPSNGCMGLGPAESWMGIGAAKNVDRLEIRWPTGHTQTVQDIAAGETVTVAEE